MFRPEQTIMVEFLRPFTSMEGLGAASYTNPYVRAMALSEALTLIQWRETKYDHDRSRVVDTLVAPNSNYQSAQAMPTSSSSVNLAQREQIPFSRSTPLEQPRAGSTTRIAGALVGLGVLGAGYVVKKALKYAQTPHTPQTRQAMATGVTAKTGSASPYTSLPAQWNSLTTTATSTTPGLNDVQQLLLQQGTVTNDMLFQEGLKLSDPGWRWCPQSLSQRTPLGAYSGAQLCSITPDGLRGEFYGIRIRATPGAVLNHTFNLYDETTRNIYAIADLVASDQGAGSLTAQNLFRPRAQQTPSNWLDSIAAPALIFKNELVRGRTESSIAAIVNVVGEAGGVLRAIYCRRATVSFMDDQTVESYRGAAGRIGGYGALAAHSSMLDELRLGYAAANRVWVVE